MSEDEVMRKRRSIVIAVASFVVAVLAALMIQWQTGEAMLFYGWRIFFTRSEMYNATLVVIGLVIVRYSQYLLPRVKYMTPDGQRVGVRWYRRITDKDSDVLLIEFWNGEQVRVAQKMVRWSGLEVIIFGEPYTMERKGKTIELETRGFELTENARYKKMVSDAEDEAAMWRVMYFQLAEPEVKTDEGRNSR